MEKAQSTRPLNTWKHRRLRKKLPKLKRRYTMQYISKRLLNFRKHKLIKILKQRAIYKKNPIIFEDDEGEINLKWVSPKLNKITRCFM